MILYLAVRDVYRIGFVSTTSFDEVQIKNQSNLALDLGSTKVYNLFFEKFCADLI
jgi:hypothetical protein